MSHTDDQDEEIGKTNIPTNTSLSVTKKEDDEDSSSVVAGACYAFASGSMILINKYALDPKSFGFSAPTVFLFTQCFLSVVLVKLYEQINIRRQANTKTSSSSLTTITTTSSARLQPLSLPLIRVWLPVNILFVCMIGSSFFALRSVGVAMVTVWKNVANVITAFGDVFIYKKSFSIQVWLCLLLMLCSAVLAGSTDLSFSWEGYIWQIANCLFTSMYALYLRSAMDKTAEHTTNKQKMDELSMVYYNNLLSLPFTLLLIFVFQEHISFFSSPALSNPYFFFAVLVAGVLGFSISFCSLWFLSKTNATTYSLVGALNKIPVAVIGIVIFREPTNTNNLMSISLGLGAGVLFVYAKAIAA